MIIPTGGLEPVPANQRNCPLMSHMFIVPKGAVQGAIVVGGQSEASPVVMGAPCSRNKTCAWWSEKHQDCVMVVLALKEKE